MKTTLEISDAVFRKAKAKAVEQGIPLRQFITEAVEAKLTSDGKPWMQVVGRLRHLKKENARIDRIIEEEFGQIERLPRRNL
jgi:hypothetical protein